MKRFIKWVLPLVMVCMLTGCSDGAISEETAAAGSEGGAEVSTVTARLEEDYAAVMPILSIDTKNGSTDFATKPVSGHVSKEIASWTRGYKIPPEPYYEDCVISLKGSDENVLLSGIEAQVKVHGNWTTTYDKKAFRIKFAEKQNLLGLNDGAEVRNWLLLAEYKDGSMLRNKTAFAIGRELLEADGLYSSDAELVEVYIDGEYWGVYLLAEQQQINEERVAITEAEEGYTGTDIGYFLEFDGYFVNEDELQQFHVDYADNAPLVPYDGNGGSGRTITCLSKGKWDYKKDIGFTIKSDIYSEEQRDFIADFVDGAYRIMYEAAYNDKAYEFNADYTELVESTLTPREAVENVVDVQSLVDMYIISELTCDADIYWSSFFMSADFGADGNKKLTFTAPWDFDSALGNKERCADGQGFYASNIVPDVNFQYETANPWLVVLAYEDWYQDMIKEKWTSAYDGGVFDRAYEMIERDKTVHSDAFDRNYDRWNNLVDNDSFAGELSRNAAKCRTHAEAADYLAEWLRSRVEFLNGQWHK
ncbi:MAG: CotH kinase family protein [Oscillospiraceae bacterium]|nr:CotH kinase family protein [Oscillospiraceae bacterium]